MIYLQSAKEILEDLKQCHMDYSKKLAQKKLDHLVGKRISGKIITEDIKRDFCDKLKKWFDDNDVIDYGSIFVSADLEKLAVKAEDLFGSSDAKFYSKILLDILGYDDFSKNGNNGEWCRSEYIKKLGIRVCPYCNREYITSYEHNGNSHAIADLDHYYPKEQYPLLSMNIYNLIPCCSMCNSRLKGNKKIEKGQNHLHPYFDSSESLQFSIDLETLEDLYNFNNKIDAIYLKSCKGGKLGKRAEKSKELFKLEDVYKEHCVEVSELKQNILTYSKSYVNNTFIKNYSDLFEEQDIYDVIDRTVFAFNYKSDSDEPLTKLKKDIYSQMVN